MVNDGQAGDPVTATTSRRLHAWVREDFGVDLTSIDPVAHGADEAAELWRAASMDGTRYAVKLSGGGSPAGLVVSAHLAEHGVPGVPRPVSSRAGRLWSEREGRRLSVVPWVSDARALDGGMNAEQWTFYGTLLAQVHATAVTDAIATLLPRDDHTHHRVASIARAVDGRLRAFANDPATAVPADDLVRALAEEWRAAAGSVSTLLDQADVLGRRLRTEQTRSVICHADPHLGNLLLDGRERVWLVDWDDAILAPRECDLMFVIGGVLDFAPVTPQQQSWFFDGYGPVDVDPTGLAYYRCTRALIDVADFAAHVLDVDRYTEPERANALSIVRAVLSPPGLVNLALSSLRELRL